MQLIELRSVADAQQDGILSFHVPGDKNQHQAIAQDIEAEDKSNYVWTGELLDVPGSITIVSEKGNMSARIDIDGKNYEIYPLEGDVYAMVERTPVEWVCPDVEVAEDAEIEPEEEEETGSINGREVGCTAQQVRVLVLSTPAARRTGLNPQTVANQAIADFNRAQSISAVNGRINLVLAGMGDWNHVENRLAQTDVPLLAGNANVRNLRAAVDADLVVCLTDGNYADALGRVDAIGPDFNRAFAVIEIETALSPFVFVHEVGHLYGLQHEDCAINPIARCLATTAGTFDHAFNFDRPGALFRRIRRYRTVMHNPNDRQMLLNFSNPDVNYDTRATGRAGEYDNAREMEIRDRTVANFDRTEPLTANIQGPQLINRYTGYTWEAVYSCGNNYTFQWEMSDDGFTYYPAGTGERLGTSVTNSSQYRVYLRVRVSSGGRTATAFLTVSVNGSNFRRGIAQSDSVTWDNVLEHPEENGIVLDDVYPNPTYDQSQVGFYLPEQQTIRLDVIDLSGKLMKNVVGGDFEAGSYEFNVDHSSLATGVYLYQLKAGDVALTKRLVIRKE